MDLRVVHQILEVGGKYSKKELARLLDQPALSSVREGIFSNSSLSEVLLFADLEKQDKELRFRFNDFFEGEYFHWDSQTTQHLVEHSAFCPWRRPDCPPLFDAGSTGRKL